MAWNRASASQITAWRRCPSRWYANKIMGLSTPETEAMRRGKALHAQLEAWELSGDPSHLTALVRPVLGVMSVPEGGLERSQVERRVWRKTDAVPLLGFIDLELPAERTVCDHKTTSDFKYCKNEYTLGRDAQAIIYCMDALDRWGGEDPITFRHIYYRTRGVASTRVVEVDLEPDTIRERFAELVSELLTMMEHSRIESFAEVPANLDACQDYGGCPFSTQCRDAGKLPSIYGGLDGDETMPSLMDLIKAKKNAAPAVEPPPQPEPEVAVNPPDGAPADEVVALPKAKDKPLRLPDGMLLSTARRAELTAAWHVLRRDDIDLAWDGESKTSNTALREDLTKLLAMESPEAKVTQAIETAKGGTELPQRIRMLLALPTSPDTADRWREVAEGYGDSELEIVANMATRPCGTPTDWQREIVADILAPQLSRVEAVEAPTEEPAPAPTEEPAPAPAEAPEAPADVRIGLYVGCHPQGVAVAYLDELLAPLQESVARDAKVDHYNLLPYAEGPKRVAALLARALRDGDLTLPHQLVIPSRAPCADAVLEVVMPYFRRAGALIVGRLG